MYFIIDLYKIKSISIKNYILIYGGLLICPVF